MNKVCPFDEFQAVGRLLLDASYRFAKTMPQFPHFYTLGKTWPNRADFERVILFMREYGYSEQWAGHGKPQTFRGVLNVNDHKYFSWELFMALESRVLINRAHHKDPALFDDLALIYDERWPGMPGEVASMLRSARGPVLDVGCGTGSILAHWQPADYLGIDPSLPMLNQLLTVYPGMAGKVVQSRLEEFIGVDYGLIMALHGSPGYVAPHALNDLPRRLRPGGRFFLMFEKTGEFAYGGQPAGDVTTLGEWTVVQGGAR